MEREWVWQGWFGPMNIATAAKVITDADTRAGAWVPEPGKAPASVNLSKTVGMMAVLTRPSAPMPMPAGMEEADPAIVARLVGG